MPMPMPKPYTLVINGSLNGFFKTHTSAKEAALRFCTNFCHSAEPDTPAPYYRITYEGPDGSRTVEESNA